MLVALGVPAVARAADGSGGSLYGLLLPIQAGAMAASFLLLLGGMFFPRFFKHRKWWLKIHRHMGTVGEILGLLGVGLAICTILRTTGVRLRLPRLWVGLVTIVLLVVTPVFGRLMLKIRKNTKRYRAVHRWIGRLTLLSLAATIVLGMFALSVL